MAWSSHGILLSLLVFLWQLANVCRFGKLRRHGHMAVGKDRESWQELQCYLFAEMLICIKEKRVHDRHQYDDQVYKPKTTRCTLKGSILIKKHLKSIEGPSGKPSICINLR